MPSPRRVPLISSDPTHCRRSPCMFHGRIPEGAYYVGRKMPGLDASPYANPYKGDGAAERYRVKLLAEPALVEAAAYDIGDRDVACWCPVSADCHGDALLELIAALREAHDAEPWELA